MADKKKKTILEEFGEFIARGNVMDLAVGVIVGGAFTTVVNSLVEDVVNPFVSIFTGGTADVPGMAITINGISIDFGAFLGSILNFLITAAAVFAIVKALNAFNEAKELAAKKVGLEKKQEEEARAPEPRRCPYCLSEIPDAACRCPNCTSKLEGYQNLLD